jgi:hypothetical protein
MEVTLIYGSIVSFTVPMLLDTKRALVLVLIVVLAFSMAQVLFDSQLSLRVSGVITSVPIGVYWDAGCTSPVESINWGNVTVGGVETLTMYVENFGNESFYLTVQMVNWQADNASNVASFSCEEPQIGPGQVAMVDPTLTIFPNASGVSSFSFDVAFSETFVTLGDFDTLFGNNTSVTVIYPSTSTDKPLGCSPAMVTDWLASAYVTTKLTNFTDGLDNESAFVDQTTGIAVGASGTGIISFGGPVVNPVVKYAESSSTPSADRAPIMFNNQGGVVSFEYANGTSIPGASMSASAVNGNQDFFVIETFMDGAGRYQLLCYGFGWEGTYAAGLYFNEVIYPNLASQSESWIIVKWFDANGNGFVDGPNQGDTYTIIAQGN